MVYARVANGFARFKAKLKFPAKRFKLQADKTYIFPTGFGFAFGILSFILLVMAIGFGNNVLYFFVFLLVSMGISTSWLTNNNIDYVRINDIQNDFLFANEINNLQLKIVNKKPKRTPIYDIEMQVEHDNSNNDKSNLLNCCEQKNELTLQWIPPTRGAHEGPRVKMQSRFPYLLLRSWKFYESSRQFLIYPERKGHQNMQALLGHQSKGDEAAKLETEGLFRDFREFQNSDAPNRIDWKRSVKHQKHLVKNYEKSGERKILIDWDMTSVSDSFEDRISQLAKWVDICYQNNEVYALRIKNQRIDYSMGVTHYRSCLDKLAYLQQRDVA